MTAAAVPNRARFLRLARRYNLSPVVREILGDLETPVSAFRKLSLHGSGFLLESVEGGETWGRYSILGVQPAGCLRAWGDRIELEWRGRRRRSKQHDPLRAVEKWLALFHPAPVPGLPRFYGGAVGSIGFDVVRRLQRLPRLAPLPAADSPDLELMLVVDLIVFDNLSHTLKLVACAVVDGDAPAAYRDAVARLDRLESMLAGPAPPDERPVHRSSSLRSETSRRDFEQRVRRARQHILAGDIFQVVLSHELRAPLRSPPLSVYRALRCINPSPYMYFLDFGHRQILGTSPEVLVRVEDEVASLRPIAGTRRRGENEEEDRRRIADLIDDAKERAEHVMLVDLGRNDLGRVCEFGSVQTRDFMSIERYSHVIHLVSQVSGRLREGTSCFDALRASFPAGTVSGAPKVRAMEIIDELEQRRRGVYAGAVGYFSFGGTMDTCIAIRTVVCADGLARVGVGAGIVLDSRPEREWEETLEKAGAAQDALKMAERGLMP